MTSTDRIAELERQLKMKQDDWIEVCAELSKLEEENAALAAQNGRMRAAAKKIRLEYDYAGGQEADSEGLPYIHGLADLKKALNGGEKGSGG